MDDSSDEEQYENEGCAFFDRYMYNEKRELHSYNDKPTNVWFLCKTKEWYKEGKRHRDDDKSAYISNKTVEWYNNGIIIKEMTRKNYNKLLRLYCAIQLYRKKSVIKILHFILNGTDLGY